MPGTTSAYIYRRPLEMPGRASRAAPPEGLTQISRWTNWGSLAVKAVAASHEKMFRAIKKEKDGFSQWTNPAVDKSRSFRSLRLKLKFPFEIVIRTSRAKEPSRAQMTRSTYKLRCHRASNLAGGHRTDTSKSVLP